MDDGTQSGDIVDTPPSDVRALIISDDIAHTSAFIQYFKTAVRLSYNDILRHNHKWSSYLDNINFVWLDLPMVSIYMRQRSQRLNK